MSAPDPLGPLRRRDGDAVFEAAWQAEALALADALVRRGVFSASAWAEALGAALRGQPDDTTDSYYTAVLAALETLLGQGPLPSPEIEARRDAWARAYRNTPHGEPVRLESA